MRMIAERSLLGFDTPASLQDTSNQTGTWTDKQYDKQNTYGAGVGLLVSTFGTQMTRPVHGQTSNMTRRILMAPEEGCW